MENTVKTEKELVTDYKSIDKDKTNSLEEKVKKPIEGASSNQRLSIWKKSDLERIEKEYRNIATKVAQPVMEEISKTFGVKYNVKVLIGEEEAKKELGSTGYIINSGVTSTVKDNTLYIVTDKDYYKSAMKTVKQLTGSQNDSVPLPITIVREYLRVALEGTKPKTQEKKGYLKALVGEDLPLGEFYVELLTHLFWRKTHGEEIPEHRYKLGEIINLYKKGIVDSINENKRVGELEKRIEKMEEAVKLFDQGYKYVAEKNGNFYGARSEEEIVGKYFRSKEEMEKEIKNLQHFVRSIKEKYSAKVIAHNKAYMLGALVAEEMWKQYGEKSINMLIDGVKKYENVEAIVGKDVLQRAVSRYKSILEEINS